MKGKYTFIFIVIILIMIYFLFLLKKVGLFLPCFFSIGIQLILIASIHSIYINQSPQKQFQTIKDIQIEKERQTLFKRQKMNITKGQNKLCCKEHINQEIQFIQVNQILDQQDSNSIFSCNYCVNDKPNLLFKETNYQLISQLLEEGSSHIIEKWPPVNDYSIITQLQLLISKGDQHNSITDSIIKYFCDLKQEILKKIDFCQNQILNRISDQYQDSSKILHRYQEISKITKLKALLSNEQKYTLQKQEEVCKKFIQKVEADKQRNTEFLQDLLDQAQRQQNLISFEYPNLIKKQILNSIDQISFINQNINNQILNNNHKEMNNDNKVDLIMKLVSNKSNFCSDEFLSSLNQLLNTLSPQIQQLSIDNAFQQSKQPIRFQELTNQKLELIQDYVNHTIQLKNNNQYFNEIKNTYEKKYLEELINNKVNSTSNNFKEQIEQYLVDTYPFLKQINFTNAQSERCRFECFKDLSQDILNDLFILAKKRQDLEQINKFNNSQTNNVLKQQMKAFTQIYKEEEIKGLFRKYPIFDLINQQMQNQVINQHLILQDLIPIIQLNQYQYNKTHLNISKNQDNNYEVYSQKNQDVYCISNLVLEKDKKYIFRIKVESQNDNNQEFKLGFRYNNQGFFVTADFQHVNNFIKLKNNTNIITGICKQIKGNRFNTPIDSLLEMRVCQNESIIEILDYPNYTYKIGIHDRIKENLINNFYDQQQLLFGLSNKNIKLTLISAFIVNSFID